MPCNSFVTTPTATSAAGSSRSGKSSWNRRKLSLWTKSRDGSESSEARGSRRKPLISTRSPVCSSTILLSDRSVAANAQRVSYPVDVVEPGGDQRDLQNALVVEARIAQPVVIFGTDLGCVLGELDHVVEHRPLQAIEGRFFVIPL